MKLSATYEREARRVETMRRVSAGDEQRYWEGYQRGLIDSQQGVAPDQLRDHQQGYDLGVESIRRDPHRVVTALGYWDGRRMSELGAVMDYYQRLTPDQWLARYGVLYGISSRQYVYQMCREDTHSSGYSKFQLPHPFVAEADGNRWLITTKDG